jgi:hypothetical protein
MHECGRSGYQVNGNAAMRANVMTPEAMPFRRADQNASALVRENSSQPP